MNKINWKIRFSNKTFWVTVIPAIALLVQAVLSVFDITVDFSTTVGKLLVVVDTAFAVMIILGIVVDPTTVGISDSQRALEYTEPKKDEIPTGRKGYPYE